MRKKSHISLALYLIDNISFNDLLQHKLSFCIGNVLPDCKPSFLTTRHEITSTFDMVKENIKKLTIDCAVNKEKTSAYFRDLGQVIHYLADYFTYPHNTIFEGNLKDHCIYEKKLKFALREYIKSGEADRNRQEIKQFTTLDSLFEFILSVHEEYLKIKKSVEEDCKYIVSLCHQVVEGILYLLGLQRDNLLIPAIA